MIRINLLPVRQTQKRQTVQQQMLVAVAALAVVLLGTFAWYYKVSSDAASLQAQIAAKQSELDKLKKAIGEVNSLKAKKKELEDKQKIIEDLRKGKTGPVRALDDLATEIPDRVWITGLTETGSAVALEGLAVTNEDVSAFMKSLQSSKYFSTIRLDYSRANKGDGGVEIYQFRISCQVDYSA